MAATKYHWRSHVPHGQYVLNHAHQAQIGGHHCSHQPASCHCHNGYYDNHHHHHRYQHGLPGIHQHHLPRQHYHHHGNVYTHPPPHHHHNTHVIHRHYTEQESPPKLIPLPPPEPKPCRHDTSQQLSTQEEASTQLCTYESQTQVNFECESCERHRCIQHDAECQVSVSCPECDQARYCRSNREVQASFDCEVCEGRKQIMTRDMATQVEEMDTEAVVKQEFKETRKEERKETKKEDIEEECEVCTMLLERLTKQRLIVDEEMIGSYVVQKSSKPKVKVTKKEREPIRTSTPRQGPFDTYAEHLRDPHH